MSHFIFRTDASQQIGSGHVMRCITLAEELRDLGMVAEFVTRDYPGNLNEYIKGKGFKVYLLPDPILLGETSALDGYEQWLGIKQVTDAGDTIQAIASQQPDWLIVDHYALDQKWESKLRPHVGKIMVIDDLANREHDCDLLLDQNYINDKSRYDSLLSPDTIKLLGPKYSLLRKEFIVDHAYNLRNYGIINRVFVFFGGADPSNMTSVALQVLLRPELKYLLVDVVIGSANKYKSEIQGLVAKHPNAELHIQIENIADLMKQADVALGAGGSTTWERMAVGLPSIVVTIASNQIAFTRDLDRDGYINWIGGVDQVNDSTMYKALQELIDNPYQICEQSQKCQGLFDGTGTQAIINLLTVGPDVNSFVVKRATSSDSLLFWYWAKNLNVGENTFNAQVMEWDEYKIYFNKLLNDNNIVLLLIESNFGIMGQVCFNYSDLHYKADYSVIKQFCEFNLDRAMLIKAISYLKARQYFFLNTKEQRTYSSETPKSLCSIDALSNKKSRKPFLVTVLSDAETWMNPWICELLADWSMEGHWINWVNKSSDVSQGDFCFILSCSELVKADVLAKNKHNLVVHESDLPKGRGWSPLSWQILEGAESIPVTLFEAEGEVDSGVIYLQERIKLNGGELVDELRQKQASVTAELCDKFIKLYPDILSTAREQVGSSSFYPKRGPEDSMLDPNLTLVEQFNLLRIVDNEKYPAYFDWQGQRYFVKVEKYGNSSSCSSS